MLYRVPVTNPSTRPLPFRHAPGAAGESVLEASQTLATAKLVQNALDMPLNGRTTVTHGSLTLLAVCLACLALQLFTSPIRQC